MKKHYTNLFQLVLPLMLIGFFSYLAFTHSVRIKGAIELSIAMFWLGLLIDNVLPD